MPPAHAPVHTTRSPLLARSHALQAHCSPLSEAQSHIEGRHTCRCAPPSRTLNALNGHGRRSMLHGCAQHPARLSCSTAAGAAVPSQQCAASAELCKAMVPTNPRSCWPHAQQHTIHNKLTQQPHRGRIKLKLIPEAQGRKGKAEHPSRHSHTTPCKQPPQLRHQNDFVTGGSCAGQPRHPAYHQAAAGHCSSRARPAGLVNPYAASSTNRAKGPSQARQRKAGAAHHAIAAPLWQEHGQYNRSCHNKWQHLAACQGQSVGMVQPESNIGLVHACISYSQRGPSAAPPPCMESAARAAARAAPQAAQHLHAPVEPPRPELSTEHKT